MPTNTNAYNSRVTDEALEKRFRDTFRAQGGSELVDDLYAQGVIVPIVDFTAAATGQQLAQNLQTAWDFSTGFTTVNNSSATIINNAGFWQVDLQAVSRTEFSTPLETLTIALTDGLSVKKIWAFTGNATNAAADVETAVNDKFVVFLRSGDSVTATSANTQASLNVWYRQIATVSGDLIDPSGFTSS